MMRKALLLLTMLILAGAASAQTVILDVQPDLDSIPKKFGPNRTHFMHLFIGYGMNFGSQHPGARVRLPGSSVFDVGLRYKLKLSNTFSGVADLGVLNLSYDLLQEKGKMVPDTILHEREWFTAQNFRVSAYLRINFGERGDRVGNFIDLGSGLLAPISSQYITRDKLATGEVQEVKLTKLKTITPIQYFTEFRFGLNRWIFFAQRRMTPFFTDASGYPHMPAYSVGLLVGLH